MIRLQHAPASVAGREGYLMADKVTITVDALGGDNAPGVVLEGVEAALAADADLSVILCGPAEVVEPFASSHDRCVARATTEEISMAEHPANAVRKKKDSSIVVGCRLVKEGEAQGFFSAGSTGACLAAGTLVIGRIKGVSRPALATLVPSPAKPVVLCDVGANADCKPEYLVQFAEMASIYARKIMGVENPRVGLLNIGEEEEKGSQFAQEAHALLKAQVDNFDGNAEGRDVMDGSCDVVVCDSPTPLSLVYLSIDSVAGADYSDFRELVMADYASHDNLNVLVERGRTPYETAGRLQSAGEAHDADLLVRDLLESEGLEFTRYLPGHTEARIAARAIGRKPARTPAMRER